MGIYDRSYYRDETELPRLRPWDGRMMVTNVIIINVVLYVANFLFTSRTNAITRALELTGDSLTSPLEFYRFLSYGFAHDYSSPMHILFNMFSLYFLGRPVEFKYGRWEFLRFYVLAILVGGLVYAIRASSMGIENPVLGASGGVVAVCMLFVFNFPKAQILLFGAIPAPAWVLGAILVIGNLLGGSDQTAYDVHIAGIVFATVYFFAGWNLDGLSTWLPSWTKVKRTFNRTNLKLHKPAEPVGADDEKADRILDKIHREGQDSLTAKERKFMEDYSLRVRRKREH